MIIFLISGNCFTFMPLWAKLLNSISSNLQVNCIYLIPPRVTQVRFFLFLFSYPSPSTHFFLEDCLSSFPLLCILSLFWSLRWTQHMAATVPGCFSSILCTLCPKKVIIVKRGKCHPSFLPDRKFQDCRQYVYLDFSFPSIYLSPCINNYFLNKWMINNVILTFKISNIQKKMST